MRRMLRGSTERASYPLMGFLSCGDFLFHKRAGTARVSLNAKDPTEVGSFRSMYSHNSVVGHTYSVTFTPVFLMPAKPLSTSTKSSQPRAFKMLAAIMLR